MTAAWSEDDWRAFLARELAQPVQVRYGRARTSVVRVVTRGGARTVHLNRVFAEAPPEVRDALAKWLRSGKRARRATVELDRWIAESISALHAAKPSRAVLDARGKHHDLAALADELRRREFAGDFGAGRPYPRIGWGRFAARGARRSLRLGSFEPLAKVVRVHPVLDSAAVPASFVRYVLFHELLHALVDESRPNATRRVLHGPEFRRRERAFADTAPALAWERENIDRLLRCARAKEPFTLPARQRKSTRLSRVIGWVQRGLFDG